MLRSLKLSLFVLLCTALPAFGQIPALSSKPGAAYNLYLNYGGFTFTGTWGGTIGIPNPPSPTPAPAYGGTAAQMTEIWTRTAEKYSAFNVNVTTVDPAIAAGQAGSDFNRQAFYDNTAQLMHTVIGNLIPNSPPTNPPTWTGGGGVSYVNVTQFSIPAAAENGGAGSGLHTNWVFPNQLGGNLKWIAEASAHENGHGLNLNHQSLYSGTTRSDEYDPGTGTGVGSVAPIMGVSYSSERGTWRVGQAAASSTTIQNDVLNLLGNTNLGTFLDSGIGHTRPTATPLPLTGTTINSSSAKGIITPASSANPQPIGVANYTKDFFSFVVPAGNVGTINAVLRSGRSTITAGTADPGATLNATFLLLNSTGTAIVLSSAGIFTETINQSNLAAGIYYLEVDSTGGTTDANGNTYFDMGSYFITGSFTLTPVPEPVTVLAVAVLGLGLVRTGRRHWATVAA